MQYDQRDDYADITRQIAEAAWHLKWRLKINYHGFR